MSEEIIVRSAMPPDVSILFELIKALAEYEKLSHAVTGSAELLEDHLFGERPLAEAIVAEYKSETAGFALFFHNYSTFLTKPGIYLEDLFVLPEYRGRGIGKKLITHLAELAVERNCGRLEWSVLDWNSPAIAFYKRIGADILDEWRICRVTGDSLSTLASSS
ncbi:MAG: GNAT family N-acetyltransferase [Cyanobacteriota bacterium]|nr:GNAT family N-acetyltransferase [Cyanobacteriota bacterium]